MLFFLLVLFVIALSLLFWQGSLLVATIKGSPIVYADRSAIRDCWKLAGLSSGQTVVDLGCGNARALIIAVAEFGAKGIGVDRSLYCYFRSKMNLLFSGQSQNIKIVWGDFQSLEQELAKADAVYLYLQNETLAEIEPWLFDSIAPHTKVFSLAFSCPSHKQIDEIETVNLGHKTKIRLYS